MRSHLEEGASSGDRNREDDSGDDNGVDINSGDDDVSGDDDGVDINSGEVEESDAGGEENEVDDDVAIIDADKGNVQLSILLIHYLL